MATPIPPNSCPFCLGEVARATGGTLAGPERLALAGVSVDSRTLRPGMLFGALKAAGVGDGHAYLSAAVRAGAGAALVSEAAKLPSGLPAVVVADTLQALGALARFHLERLRRAGGLRLLAIGGAAGKTTTKELAAAAAGALFGEVGATAGNLNNLIGVPMTLFTLTEKHRAAIIECGTSLPGEIARLGEIVSPDVALVLNVDLEHSAGLGGLEQIAAEETALFAAARETAVAPADERLVLAGIPDRLRRVTFGADAAADVQVDGAPYYRDGRLMIRLSLAGTMVRPGTEPAVVLGLGLTGSCMAINAAAALAAAAALWGQPLGRVELDGAARALDSVKPLAGRLSLRSVKGVSVIDDSYNANPRSVRAALGAARENAEVLGARLAVALGDMLELGDFSAAAHQELLEQALALKPALLIGVGAEMSAACARLAASPGQSVVVAAPSPEEAAVKLSRLLRPGDLLLVKGSRSVGMERLIKRLEELDGSCA